MSGAADDEVALRELAYRYATAIDRRDAELLVSAFHPDARVRIFNPGDAVEPASEVRGHERIARFTERIARYERTFHFVGNARYDVGVGTATGEVYCVAHHLSEGVDHVMYIRYLDQYRRVDGVGDWLIVDRRLLVEWTESWPVADV